MKHIKYFESYYIGLKVGQMYQLIGKGDIKFCFLGRTQEKNDNVLLMINFGKDIYLTERDYVESYIHMGISLADYIIKNNKVDEVIKELNNYDYRSMKLYDDSIIVIQEFIKELLNDDAISLYLNQKKYNL